LLPQIYSMATIVKKKLELLKTELFSADDETVLKALSRIEAAGDDSLIKPLVEVYARSEEGSIKENISFILNQLKISKAEQELMECVSDPRFSEIRQDILSFVWNSGFTPVDHIDTICEIAIEGTFEERFECLTIVESMSPPVPEIPLMESLIKVKTFLAKKEESTRSEIISSIYESLKAFDKFEGEDE
jgi:hypothetical protein